MIQLLLLEVPMNLCDAIIASLVDHAPAKEHEAADAVSDGDVNERDNIFADLDDANSQRREEIDALIRPSVRERRVQSRRV